jgi:hypothetical protein
MSNQQHFARAVQCFADPKTRQDYFRLYSDDIVLHGYQGVEPGLESVKHFYIIPCTEPWMGPYLIKMHSDGGHRIGPRRPWSRHGLWTSAPGAEQLV